MISSGPTSADLRGAFDQTRANYFCRNCRSYIQALKGADGLRACPTRGCKNPTGFGVYWKTPRPSDESSRSQSSPKKVVAKA